jgi:hypothetical protein
MNATPQTPVQSSTQLSVFTPAISATKFAKWIAIPQLIA